MSRALRMLRAAARRAGSSMPGRRGGARSGWFPTGSARSLDLLGRGGQIAGVAVLGQLDGVAVPAGPVAGLVACHQQDGAALRVEDEQDPDLGLPRGPGT